MQDLYQKDHDVIVSIVRKVQSNKMQGSSVYEKLDNLHTELQGRLEDAGYDVSVDVTPLLEDQPVVVSVNGRRDVDEFDFERKAFEVKKRTERKDEDPEIEGMV
jgi:hypothetical protein